MKVEIISIEDVKRINRDHKQHYFDRTTMLFFSSRVSAIAHKVGNKAYFTTSERNRFNRQPRKYSIRVIDLTTGDINTVGEYQGFNSLRTAKAELKRILTEL